jgi:hypothetical protein
MNAGWPWCSEETFRPVGARLAGDGVLQIAIASKLCSYKKPSISMSYFELPEVRAAFGRSFEGRQSPTLFPHRHSFETADVAWLTFPEAHPPKSAFLALYRASQTRAT